MRNNTDSIAVSVREVSKIFDDGSGAFVALDNVSLDIGSNEFFTLLGPSGCGKTTLLRLIAGFEQPSQGQILLHGENLEQLPPFKRPVNTVFQNYALFPHMTIAQNIAFGLEMLGRPRQEINSTVDEMLDLVQMKSLADRRITQISGGQQQRVALARALAPKPKVLLLDEPLSALDLQLRKDMQIELKRLQLETGITFIFVTHDQEEALTMSDRIAVMQGGHILQVGPPRDIYEHPQHRFVAGFIGEINLLQATAGKTNPEGLDLQLGEMSGLKTEAKSQVTPGTKLALAIRPERILLAGPDKEQLSGKLINVVYHGTDTLYHFTLPDGQSLRARRQNTDKTGPEWKSGDIISWSAKPDSVAVLED
ncbi:ABC transporter ATP-binding protein [Kiloniella laminariae]|uniref:Spermidine/putrescine import ATP-binding protein PotA n=1 Tax=Kiloniella laminariae TaxID=454162 RepID=A0ABT4LGC9_9PROT|nr:ABC transporter ATP-binding protein [Kiloniella laminariae]MCZ4280166.1 ABC transporter ATP-binding protein [Kiloniella laminariae]